VYPQAVKTGKFKAILQVFHSPESFSPFSQRIFEDPKPCGNCLDSWMLR